MATQYTHNHSLLCQFFSIFHSRTCRWSQLHPNLISHFPRMMQIVFLRIIGEASLRGSFRYSHIASLSELHCVVTMSVRVLQLMSPQRLFARSGVVMNRMLECAGRRASTMKGCGELLGDLETLPTRPTGSHSFSQPRQ
jgi:hypothetical protein